MSRIGKKPIELSDGVSVAVDGTAVTVKGKLGELSIDLPAGVGAGVQDGKVVVTRADDTRRSRSFHGLARSLLANMVEGVSKGYSRVLELEGVGYRAAVAGRMLTVTAGFSSPIEYQAPEGIDVAVENATVITVSGTDKQQVGDAAARIRSFCPPEPYKGKGIRYRGEHVRRKVGKTVA